LSFSAEGHSYPETVAKLQHLMAETAALSFNAWKSIPAKIELIETQMRRQVHLLSVYLRLHSCPKWHTPLRKRLSLGSRAFAGRPSDIISHQGHVNPMRDQSDPFVKARLKAMLG
jgi:S-adenosylmethionine:tRNA-ribosyltransferase-isomerase (queuine synthetase)